MYDKNEEFLEWDKFNIEILLGQGAFGQVYKATDVKLKRTVALKILNSSPDNKIEKFRREASNQAMIDHPNVCKVYEVGSYKDLNFISMQFIDGQTLDKLKDKLSIKEKAKIIKKVADGLHAAHLTGLIHRDVKPTNILVKQKIEEKLIPYITDFGIAKQLDAPALTKENIATGSPNYMSPEQASGDKYKALDIRTDIYSTGVTLYELLAGQTPHTGERSIEVMFKIINKEPKPVCQLNTLIPKDLGSIVIKCLEKDPEKRYESAKALSEDLNRFLKGDPVIARPTGIIYKTAKKIKKHPVVSTAMTLSTILIIMLLSFWISAKVQTVQNIAVAQQWGQIINNSEHITRISHMMPIHDNRDDLKKVKDEINKIKKVMKKIGKLGYGTGYYAMGKCYSIIKEQKKAKFFFDKSLKTNYKNNDLLYQLGILNGKIYLQKHDKLKRTLNSKTFKEQTKELKKEYLEKAIYMLNQVKNSKEFSSYYGQALISYINQDYETALLLCKKARTNRHWFYEALLLSGKIHITLAEHLEIKGDTIGGEREYNIAERQINKAITIAESDIDCYKALASLWIKRFTNSRKNTDKIDLYKNNAFDALNNAKIINPEDSDLNVKFSAFYWHWAEYLMEIGKNFSEFTEKGINAAQLAIKYNPKNYEAYHHLGNCYLYEGIDKMIKGNNPEVSFIKAENNFNKSIAIAPSFILNYINSAIVYAYLGQFQYLHGQNPTETLNKGVKKFLAAEKIDPNNIFIYSNLGGVYYLSGNFLYDIGQNPKYLYEKAINSYKKALELSPADNSLYVNLCGTYVSIAEYDMKLSLNPNDNLEKAVQYAKKSIELFANNSFGLINLSSAYLISAKYKLRTNQPAEKELSLAKKYCDQAIIISPNSVDALETKGNVYIDYANYLISSKKNLKKIKKMLIEGENAIKKGLKIDSEYSSLYALLSKSFSTKAKLEKNKNKKQKYLHKSYESIKNAITLSPKYVYSYKIIADVLVNLSTFDKSPKEKLAEALDYIDKALQIDPESKQFKLVKQSILKKIIKD